MKTKIWISGICLLFTLSLSGCSKAVLHLPEGVFYLCSDGPDIFFQKDLILLDSSGSTMLQLSNAWVSACILPDGTILDQTAGQIPDDSCLLISLREEEIMSGVWSIPEQDWIIGPTEGIASFLSDSGRLRAFCLGDQYYSPDFQPFDSEENDSFTLADGLVLINAGDASGAQCIYTESGECYLDAAAFRTINEKISLSLPQNDLSIEGMIQQTYLLISGDSYDDGFVRYLCDQNGAILYSEWNYDWVSFLSNSIGSSSSEYLCFKNLEGGDCHYLNLTTWEEFVPPEGWQITGDRYNDLFLVQKEEQYAIYDAASGCFGAFLPADFILSHIWILGMDSYAFKTGASFGIVIDGQAQTLPDNTDNLLVHGAPCPVIYVSAGDSEGLSFIVDADGGLVAQTSRKVIYADDSYYLSVSRLDSFGIYSYN